MARISGNTGTLTLATVARLGLTSISFIPNRALAPATGMDSGGYEEDVDSNASATLSAEAHWDTRAGGSPPSIQTAGLCAFIFKTDATAAKTISGNLRLTSCPIKSVVDGTVTWSIEGKVQGAWTEA